jgi:hypothetical protein
VSEAENGNVGAWLKPEADCGGEPNSVIKRQSCIPPPDPHHHLPSRIKHRRLDPLTNPSLLSSTSLKRPQPETHRPIHSTPTPPPPSFPHRNHVRRKLGVSDQNRQQGARRALGAQGEGASRRIGPQRGAPDRQRRHHGEEVLHGEPGERSRPFHPPQR